MTPAEAARLLRGIRNDYAESDVSPATPTPETRRYARALRRHVQALDLALAALDEQARRQAAPSERAAEQARRGGAR